MENPSGVKTTNIYADDGETLIAVITVIETMGGTGYESFPDSCYAGDTDQVC